MRVFAAFVILAVQFAGIAFGQDDRARRSSPVTIALDAGMTLSKLASESFFIQNGPFGNMELSYMTSLQLEYQFSPQLRIRSGAGYIRLGGKSNEFAITDVEGRILDKAHWVAKLSYIEVPLLLRYVVKRRRYHPYLASGITVGFLQSTGLELDPSSVEAAVVEDGLLVPINDVAVGLGFAAGVQLPIRGSFGLDFGTTYNLELTNQLSTSSDDLSQKARSWRFTLGVFTSI